MTTPQPVQTNWQKAALLVTALVGMIALVILGQTEWADVAPVFYLIVGYGTANGIGAVKGQSPSPLFSPRNPTRRVTDSGAVELVVPLLDDPSTSVAVEMTAAHAKARCPDGAVCHHDCDGPNQCYRRTHKLGPLSGVYRADRWPEVED